MGFVLHWDDIDDNNIIYNPAQWVRWVQFARHMLIRMQCLRLLARHSISNIPEFIWRIVYEDPHEHV